MLRQVLGLGAVGSVSVSCFQHAGSAQTNKSSVELKHTAKFWSSIKNRRERLLLVLEKSESGRNEFVRICIFHN